MKFKKVSLQLGIDILPIQNVFKEDTKGNKQQGNIATLLSMNYFNCILFVVLNSINLV